VVRGERRRRIGRAAPAAFHRGLAAPLHAHRRHDVVVRLQDRSRRHEYVEFPVLAAHEEDWAHLEGGRPPRPRRPAARTVLSAGSSNVSDGRLVSSVTSHGSVDAGRDARCAYADDASSSVAMEIRSVRMTVPPVG